MDASAETPPSASGTRARRARLAWVAVSLVVLAFATLALTANPRQSEDLGRHFFGVWRTRHALAAIEDSVVLLTVAKQVGPHV